MKANKFNQGGIESFLQSTNSQPVNSTNEKVQKQDIAADSELSDTTTIKVEPPASQFSEKVRPETNTNNARIDSDKILHDYLPYLTSKKAKQNKSNRVSYILTDKAVYTLDVIEKTTGFKKNAIINAVLEKEAEELGYKK